MSTSTAADIIKKALQKIGVLAEGETPTANQTSDGLDSLNDMLDSWSGRSLLTTALVNENFPLVANTSFYTIGANKTFNTLKPINIVNAYTRDSSNNDLPVSIIPRNIYNSFTDKSSGSTGRPDSLFYDPGITQQANQGGTVYLHPSPNSNYTLFIDSEQVFSQFANSTANITFPPAYKRALIYNLAIELTSDYGSTISPEVDKIAFDSIKIIENMNSRNRKQTIVVNLPGSYNGTYNVETDS